MYPGFIFKTSGVVEADGNDADASTLDLSTTLVNVYPLLFLV